MSNRFFPQSIHRKQKMGKVVCFSWPASMKVSEISHQSLLGNLIKKGLLVEGQ
jgi:hypothetical protein